MYAVVLEWQLFYSICKICPGEGASINNTPEDQGLRKTTKYLSQGQLVCELRFDPGTSGYKTFFFLFTLHGQILCPHSHEWGARISQFDITIRLHAEQSRNWGSIFGRNKKFFFSAQCPDQLWTPSIFLFNGAWGFFPGD